MTKNQNPLFPQPTTVLHRTNAMASSSDQSPAATVTSLAVEPPSSPGQSLPRPPRHVNFSELPPKHIPRPRRRFADSCGPSCLALFAWTCLAVFAFVLFVLLLGVIFAAILHAGLPHVTIRAARLSPLEISRLGPGPVVTAGAEFVVEFSNPNERTALSFGNLTVEASSGRVGLGRSTIKAFSQRPMNATSVRAATEVRRTAVDLDEAEELASSGNPIRVVLRGTVGFGCGKFEVKGIPVLVLCCALLTDLRQGGESLCDVRILPL